MTPNPYVKQYLMTAGPTPVPPQVSQAMAAPMLYHRAPAFVEVYERVLAKLPAVFQSSNDVLTFAASGTGAMDSAVANLARPGVKVLACAGGGRRAQRGDPRRRRRLRSWCGGAAPGRVGRRRRRRRLPEGADEPAGAGVRVRVPARAGLRGRAPRRELLLRLV